ncbi:MAG: Flp pilus assembly complex ATPase component TadA [Bdellovibrionaceae bacterium]|nr:Flp pilus assembly complex ATPase component TadA [Pseudobdellovibrionaceae bacterium]
MAVNPNSHIIGITGGKGGVGKSVFAANLALAFMTEMRAPVLLIDLDAQSCGDQNFILGLREVKTISDLANFTGALSPSNVAQAISMHPSGLGFVAAVRGRDETMNVPVDLAMKQIETLSNFYKYIIVDLGTQLNPLQMSLIERATALLVVTLPEVLSVNQSLRLLSELMAASVPGDMLQIVVNKTNPSSLAPAAIAQTLRRNIVGAIPQDDVSVTGSIQRSSPFILTQPKAPVSAAHFETVRKLTGGILQQLKTLARPTELKFKREAPPSADTGGSRTKAPKNVDARTGLKLTVHSELIKAMDLKKNMTDTQGDPDKERELRKKTQAVISSIVDKEAPGMGRDERAQIIKEVLDEALGLGALEDLLADDGVTEIMVNGYNKIYIEKKGIVQLSPVTFTSNFHLRKVIERIVTPLGRQINESVPYVDARLKDGSRVNAVIEPLAIDGPSVTIRKFRKTPVNPETYYRDWNACTANMMDFLRLAVTNKMNVIISGGTGSGKTTLLNTLSGFIPANERLITIEDAAELQLKQEHVVRLETRPANMEGTGEVSIRDLVRNSLRMRPDRIIVGECRDGAALDMLQAMRTGHDGSMTTVHANNPKEAIGRLETLCMMAGMDLPQRALREQITGAVNLIVQISRLSDGSRKIISITEVQGMQGEVVTLQEVFAFKEKDFDKNRKIVGQFHATGLIPKFVENMQKRGIKVAGGLFSNEASQPAAAMTPPSGATPLASSNAPAGTKAPFPDLKKASGGDKK